jgi:hypothetical protein
MIGTLGVLTATAATSSARTGPKAQARCPPGHTHPVTADAQAQVYQVFSPEPAEIFGCAYGDRHAYFLGGPDVSDAEGGGDETHYTLGGANVAFESGRFRDFPAQGQPGAEYYVQVENLRTGRRIDKVPTGTSSAGQVGFGPVVTLIVKSDGAVAWIAENGLEREPAMSFEVHALDKTRSRLLASGPGIDPHSLALTGSTLYWTQGGKPMSTSLG